MTSQLRRPSPASLLVLLLAAGFLAGCEGSGENRVLAITATGNLTGTVFLDINGNRALDSADPRLTGARVLVLTPTSREVVTSAETTDGSFRIDNIPVGTYRVAIDPITLGDTLQTVFVASDNVLVVEPGETQQEVIGVTYPRANVAEAKRLPPGRRVFVEGVALHDLRTFGDATLHIRADSGYLRLTRVRTNVNARDSTRFLGRISTEDGRPVLDDVLSFKLGDVPLLNPVGVTTQQAATAAGGQLNAALVRVARATITDTATVAEEFRLSLNDGSGPLTVVIDRDISINRRAYVPQAVISAIGILVPAESSGVWILKPTGSRDLTLVQ